ADPHGVLQGSSGGRRMLDSRITAAGGELVSPSGVPVSEIKAGIRHGVRKVNVDTDGRLAITGALRETLNANPSEFDPRAFFKPAREAQKQVAAERLTQFGSAGHAQNYGVLSLAEVAERYARGPGGRRPLRRRGPASASRRPGRSRSTPCRRRTRDTPVRRSRSRPPRTSSLCGSCATPPPTPPGRAATGSCSRRATRR